jgi:uncharacterized protein YihD (DUF1040 family)
MLCGRIEVRIHDKVIIVHIKENLIEMSEVVSGIKRVYEIDIENDIKHLDTK